MRYDSSAWIASVTINLLTVCGFAGCHSKDNRVPEETLWVAASRAFPYLGELSAASSGDEQALEALFRFSPHVDGAAALGHGVILLDLAAQLGDERFAASAIKESTETRSLLRVLLEAGAAYTTTPGLSRPPDRLFPRTWAALSDP